MTVLPKRLLWVAMPIGLAATLTGVAPVVAQDAAKPNILLIGFDNTSAARRLLAERRMLATVDHHADRQAVFGIEYALEILSKNAIPADRETPVDLITI